MKRNFGVREDEVFFDSTTADMKSSASNHQLMEREMKRQIIEVERKAHIYDRDREYLIEKAEEDYKDFEQCSNRLIEENSRLLKECNTLRIQKEELRSSLQETKDKEQSALVDAERVAASLLEIEELKQRNKELEVVVKTLEQQNPEEQQKQQEQQQYKIPDVSGILEQLRSARLLVKEQQRELESLREKSFKEDELCLKLNNEEQMVLALKEEIASLKEKQCNDVILKELQQRNEELSQNLVQSANRQSDLLAEVSVLRGTLKGIEAMKKNNL